MLLRVIQKLLQLILFAAVAAVAASCDEPSPEATKVSTANVQLTASKVDLPDEVFAGIREKYRLDESPKLESRCSDVFGQKLCVPIPVVENASLKTTGEIQLALSRQQIETQLRTVTAHYNLPKTVRLNRSTEIALVIDGTSGGGGNQLITTFPGTPKSTDVKVSNEVSARLTGPATDVTVTLRGDERQAITPAAPTKWIWDVVPKKRGTVVLTLDVYAWVVITGNEKQVEFRTARWPIPVEATYWDITKEYVAEVDPVWKTVSAIATGLAGLLAWFGFRKKKANKDEKPADPNTNDDD